MQVATAPDELIPIGEAAKLLGRSVRTLHTWSRTGRLTAHRDERGRRYFNLGAVLALRPRADERTIPTEQSADRGAL